MKIFLLITWLVAGGDSTATKSKFDVHSIARINKLSQEAEQAYQNKSYEQAYLLYSKLTDTLRYSTSSIHLNKALSAFMAGKWKESQTAYQQVLKGKDKKHKSIAYQQLGLLSLKDNKKEEALEQFKNALLNDPRNEQARYDYELALKQKQQQQKQDKSSKQDKKEDKKEEQKKEQQQQKEEQKEQEQQASEQENEEEKQSQARKEQFEKIKISEEKAKMLLEAMKNNEKQYLQQMKKKPKKPTNKNQKGW
jgi:Ca-activated chloride channel family protein